MKAYHIMLALFIFGFVSGGINEMGLFEEQVILPDTGATISETEVAELTTSLESEAVSPLSIWYIVSSCAKVFVTGFLALLTIVPMMLSYGIPISIAMMVQGPVWLVEGWGIYQFWTGYQTGGME